MLNKESSKKAKERVTVNIVLGDKVYITSAQELPTNLKKELIKVGTWANPEISAKKAMGLSTFGVPKKVHARQTFIRAEDNSRTIAYERGLWGDVKKTIKEVNEKDPHHVYNIHIESRLQEAPVEFPQFELTLEDYQQGSLDTALEVGQGILSFPPGGGKTVLASALLKELGQRTLVVVHTRELVNQWKQTLSSKLFEGLSVSTVTGAKKDFSAKHVVVGTVQTLIKLADTQDFKDFGCIILDECHHATAPSFMSVVGRSNAKYRYGLTASLKRKDKKEFLMGAVFGDVLVKKTYDDIADRVIMPTVHPVLYNTDNCPIELLYTPRGGNIYLDYTKFFKFIMMNKPRNQLIVDLIERLLADGNNYLLVLTRMVDHAKLLYEAIKDFAPAGLLVGGGNAAYRLEKEELIKKANTGEIRVLVGTSVADEGLDIARLNTLVHVAPTSFDELYRQRIGRIARTFPGKTESNVYDIVDGYLPETISSWEKRKRFCRRLGLTVVGDL